MNRLSKRRSARGHLLGIALIYALVVPVAYFDQRDLRGSGGNWISLDLRGVYVGAYLVAAGFITSLVLLHLGVKQRGKPFSFGLVVGCLLAPAPLVPLGYGLYGVYQQSADQHRTEHVATTAEALAQGLELRWSVPSAPEPRHFELELTSATAVDLLLVSVTGSAVSRHGDFVSPSVGDGAQAVRLRPGVAHHVSLALDYSPPEDTYWSVYCRFEVAGTTVNVSWVDPSQEARGGDVTRLLPLH